jgi:hypothetical protein
MLKGVDMSSLRAEDITVVPRRELLIASGLTVAAASLLMLGPAPGDAPAHLYRTLLVQHGAVIWDNLWYAGQYPLASYSLLYYFPAALVGNLPLVLVAAVASTVLFALIGFHEWNVTARWPIRIFGVLAAAPVFTGLYSYTLGFATLLAVLRAVQRGKTWLAIICAALTLGFSPLAFVFLCLILLALLLAKPQMTGRTIGLAVGLVGIAVVEAGVLIMFPSTGVYPFSPFDLVAVIAVCLVGALLARRGDGVRVITWFFIAWGVGSLFAFVVPSAVGDNVTRLRAFVFPLMLVAAAQARFRPRFLTVVALAGALAYNIGPYLMLVPYRLESKPESAAFWRPAIAFLEQHRDPNYRVEVVPTAAHWESYWIPRAGYPLARGWYRQLDVAGNPVLYAPHLDGAQYMSWLRRMSVKYVLLPRTQLDPDAAPTEARLLRRGTAGIRPVFRSANWTIYELAHPQPLFTGPAQARLTAMGHQVISGVVGAAGLYTLGIHFNRYWTADPRVSCVRAGPGGMTLIRFREPGAFTLRISNGLDSLLDSFTKSDHTGC